jgi:RecB family endonuclease NucS
MLRIDKSNKMLFALERKTLRESGYWERRDVQEMICHAPSAFCEELGPQERFHLIGSEIRPTDFVENRIDLLAVDPDGGAVIIELKRDSDKLQLLQALSYAGMVDKWEPKRFIEELVYFSEGKQQTLEHEGGT